METQVRADHKNAEIRSRHKADFSGLSGWRDEEAPEEEVSDLSNEEDSETEGGVEVESTNTAAPSPIFLDGLEFYLVMSQVCERTVGSVLELGVAKTLSTLQDQMQNESIATIEQQYPDVTCLSTNGERTIAEQPPMDLLTALRLSSVPAIAQQQSLLVERPVTFHKVDIASHS